MIKIAPSAAPVSRETASRSASPSLHATSIKIAEAMKCVCGASVRALRVWMTTTAPGELSAIGRPADASEAAAQTMSSLQITVVRQRPLSGSTPTSS
jgi:hypothetical protein